MLQRLEAVGAASSVSIDVLANGAYKLGVVLRDEGKAADDARAALDKRFSPAMPWDGVHTPECAENEDGEPCGCAK